MRNRIAALFALGLLLASSARGAGEWFILDNASGWHTNDPAHPVSRGLQRFANSRLKSVAFTPDGDWVILFGGNGVWTSNTQHPGIKKLIELMNGNDLKCIAFTPDNGWCVFWNQNGYQASGIPDAAFKRVEQVAKDGGTLRSIAFSPTGGWVLLFDQAGVYYGGIPPELADILKKAVAAHNPVECVSFTNRGEWFVITANGWWTSNLDHPAAKELARLSDAHKLLKWVTVAPELGEHHFDRWAPFIAKAYDGKMLGGYAFEVLHHGEIVASGAHGWCALREKILPSIPWTLQTPMGIASVSKTISAVALLRLWEQTGEKFSLDAPFWPHLRLLFPSVHEGVKNVTIRQLLTHRSGFKAVADCTTPAALQKLFDLPLEHPPGEHYEYENNNFYIIRLLIEQIGHVQYTPYVKAHVLAPMGITEMETHFGDHSTCGYEKPQDLRPGFPFAWNCDAWAGAAGWYGSAADLGLFLKGLRDHRVLNARTTAMMFKDQLGWDTSSPGIAKNGGWMWDEGARPGARAGQYKSAIVHFPDDVDATMLVNCDAPIDPEPLLFKAWYESQRVEAGR